jgi:predicted transcriptional regulator
MATQTEVDRLRREADAIMTRIHRVEEALDRARSESGDHWETGELDVTLTTPDGDEVRVTLDLDSDAARNAQRRYERAKELESDLARRESVDDRFDPLPADPLAYLLLYHLDAVGGNYPRSMAGHLDADRDRVDEHCRRMMETGLLERVESGTVKQRRVKAKQADEVRQHHTYYRLSRDGDHLLRFLGEREGKGNVLSHLLDARRIAERLDEGPATARTLAGELDESFESVRHHCRALQRVGLVTTGDGASRSESGGGSGDDSGPRYALTTTGADLVSDLA